MNHILNDALIVTSGVVAQAASGNIVDLGSAVSALGPTALLGVGIVWAIRRGDKLVDEVHELREKHDQVLDRTIEAMTRATEIIANHTVVIQHCKDGATDRRPRPLPGGHQPRRHRAGGGSSSGVRVGPLPPCPWPNPHLVPQ